MINKKKLSILLMIWIVWLIPVCFIVKNSAVNYNIAKIDGVDETYTVDDIDTILGYQVENHSFQVSSYDPNFYLENINKEIATIQLVFDKPLENYIDIQVFYKKTNEELSEENSIRKYIYEDTEEVFLSIPKSEYEMLRFDIEGSFSLKEINLSKNEIIIENHGKVKISIWAYIVAALLEAIVLMIGMKLCEYILPKIKEIWINKGKYKLEGIILLCYVMICLLLGVMYKYGITTFISNRYVFIKDIALASILFVIIVNIRNIKKHFAGIISCLIVIMGLCYALTLPIGTQVSTDDEVHYERVVRLSHVFDGYITEADEYIYTNKVLPEYQMNSIVGINTGLEYLSKHGVSVKADGLQTRLYVTIAYIPSAIGHVLGRGLGCSFAITFFIGKCINVFVYALLVYFAIRKLKSGKLILAIISLLPTNIFFAASYGYDIWLTGFMLLAIATIIGYIQDKDCTISRKSILILMLLFLIGLSPKAIYFPLIGLCFLVPKERFGDKKDYKFYCICVSVSVVFVLMSFVLPFFFSGAGADDMRGGSDVNSMGQIKFILTNPLSYTQILLNHLKSYLAVENQASLLASMMHMGNSHYFVLVFLTMTATIFCDREEVDDYANHMVHRLWTLFVVLVCVVLISTALYVSFTGVASPVIQGCQYRYLMPLVYPTAYFVFNIKVTNRANKNLMYLCAIGVMVFAVMSAASEQWISLYQVI